jgi:hypothetical protein
MDVGFDSPSIGLDPTDTPLMMWDMGTFDVYSLTPGKK